MAMRDSKKEKDFMILAFTFFLWGSSYVASKLIAEDIPPTLLAPLRCMVAVVPLFLMARKHLNIKVERKDIKWFCLVGFLGHFVNINLIQWGIELAGASMASLISALTPVSVTILASVILKEKITPVKYVCIALALAGTVIITGGAESRGEMAGVLIMLFSIICWGLASVFMRRLTMKYPAILVTFFSMSFSLLLYIPEGILTAVTQPVHISFREIAVIVYIGVFSTGLAQFTWTRSLSRIQAGTCSLLYPLQPMFSALLGFIILGEKFHYTFFIGMLLIAADIVLCTREVYK